MWPPSTASGELRTINGIRNIVQQLNINPALSKNEAKGFVGQSLLLDIPNFNFILDIPTEYMHSFCLGVMKRLLELTFKIGEVRSRITKRKLLSPTLYNSTMHDVKVPKEFSRRARTLDLSVMKAQELRNVLLFFFPIVLTCIPNEPKEKQLWLLLTFMIRACIVPTIEFQNVNLAHVEQSCTKFYTLFYQLFGDTNCSYSVHLIGTHLLQMRHKGPFTFTSAFIFESFYGEMRQSFTPGTTSTLKQILEKILLKRILGHHNCETSIYFSHKDTALECNSYIYTFTNNKHNLYIIQEIDPNNNDLFTCCPLGYFPAKFNETPNLNWTTVGVFRQGGMSSDCVVVNRASIAGKVIKVCGLLITCPNNILREK